ncbi:MAG TPA: diacylglycerol kinase family protein [Bacteroidia bacterium]|jgi:diacylglycerol kinase
MERKRFSISERVKSFGYALDGLGEFFKSQHNAWIHLFAAVFVIFLAVYLRITSNEWCWIIIAVSMVFLAELFNTAIEYLSDIVSPNLHPQIKKVKDVAAAAVLIAALGAAVIGMTIFLPKLENCF